MATIRTIAIIIVIILWLSLIILLIFRNILIRLKSDIKFVISHVATTVVNILFTSVFCSTVFLFLGLLQPEVQVIFYFVILISLAPLIRLLPFILPIDSCAMRCVTFSHSLPPENGFSIGHLSDLHLTNDRTLAGIQQSIVQEIVDRNFKWAMKRTDAVFITGDITDQGRPGEWDQFLNIITSSGNPLHEGRIFLVPGNHDLSLVTELKDEYSSALSYEKNAYTFITKILTRCPEKWMMLGDSGLISVRAYLESVSEYLSCYETYPPSRIAGVAPGGMAHIVFIGYHKELVRAGSLHKTGPWPSPHALLCRDFLRLAYPMVLLDNDRYLVIGLNSCDQLSYSLLSSGFGCLGSSQIKRFEYLIKGANGRWVIVLLHHHVGIPTEVLKIIRKQEWSRFEIRALFLYDSYKFANVLSKLSKCIVFHGHMHIGYQALLGNAIVISGNSVTYGNELGKGNSSILTIDSSGKIYFNYAFNEMHDSIELDRFGPPN